MPTLKPRSWGPTLDRMQRLSAEDWASLDPVARWLVATRAPVLVMTLSAAALGGLLAWRDHQFQWLPWLLAAAGLLLAHATNNLLNDYTDSRRGIDRDNGYRTQYGVHVLEQGLVSGQGLFGYIALTGGLAIACGITLIALCGGLTLALMLAGAFFVLFYSWPLKYFGLGEPAVLLVWGPLMVGGTYYVCAGQWSWNVCWLSIIFALGPTAVLFGKHTDKAPADRAKGVHTLPVLLGDSAARASTLCLLAGQYVGCALLLIDGQAHWPLLLVLAGLWRLRQIWPVYRAAKPESCPEAYPTEVWPLWFSAHAFRHTRLFSGLFVLALLVSIALTR